MLYRLDKQYGLKGSGVVASLPYRGKFIISQVFFNRSSRYASGYHLGVDLVGLENKTIYAISEGIVFSAGYNSAFGNTVVVQQNDGLYCRYSHLQSIDVKSRQPVLSGKTIIGLEGQTGNVTGGTDPRHLDLRLSVKPHHTNNLDDYRDPCEYLGFPNRLHWIVVPGEFNINKVNNIILCKSDIDKRAAGYLADYLDCRIIDYDLLPETILDQVFQNIIVIGSDDKPIARAVNIFGKDRYETCQKVLDYIDSVNGLMTSENPAR